MLRPTAVKAALQSVLDVPGMVADTALVILNESGTIYSQAHRKEVASPVASSSRSQEEEAKPKHIMTESQRLQHARQPGLSSLLGTSTPPLSRRSTLKSDGTEERQESSHQPDAGPSTSSTSAIELSMDYDEKAKILAAIACQAWMEETNRVRRLFSKIHGHSTGAISDSSAMMRSFSTSTGGAGSGTGNGKLPSKIRRVEQSGLGKIEPSNENVGAATVARLTEPEGDEEEIESVATPLAVPGLLLSASGGASTGVAPLLVECEMGALLVMPLNQAFATAGPPSPGSSQRSPLLLLLSVSAPCAASKEDQQIDVPSVSGGASMLSPPQWNDLYDAAQAFASHISPSLRKAFGGESTTGEREAAAGDMTNMSEVESSVGFYAGEHEDLTQSMGISVR